MLYLGMRLVSIRDTIFDFYPRLAIRDGGRDVRRLEQAELREALPDEGGVMLQYEPATQFDQPFAQRQLPDGKMVVLQLPENLRDMKRTNSKSITKCMALLREVLLEGEGSEPEPGRPQDCGIYPVLRCDDAREALEGRAVHLNSRELNGNLAGEEILLRLDPDSAIGPFQLPQAPEEEIELDPLAGGRRYFFVYREREGARGFFPIEGLKDEALYTVAATRRMTREAVDFTPDEELLRDAEDGEGEIPAEVAELRWKLRLELQRRAAEDARAELERARNELDEICRQRQEILDTFRREMDEHSQQVACVARTALHSELGVILMDAASATERDDARRDDAPLEKQLRELAQSRATGPDAIDDDMTAEQIADALVERFLKYRDYERNYILNLLICLTQGFLTVFSGDPGTGKTSVCRILAHVLGLDSDEREGADEARLERFVNVSVERGWASKKDFVGYYNPLTKRFDKANSAVYRALRASDAEVRLKLGDAVPLSLILLDEANLSPMEYYWADFMRAFDNCGDVVISLSERDQFRVANSLRFAATINNDHTTESLSPRLVDRAWIISLPRPKMPRYTGFEQFYSPVPLRALRKAFDVETRDGSIPLDDPALANSARPDCEAKLAELLRACREKLDMDVAGRLELDFRRYCRVGLERFERDARSGLEGWQTAFDYAVAQKILPKIQGSGADYERRLIEFNATFNEILENRDPASFDTLFYSSRLLRRIIRRGGKNMQYYQFFA